MKTLILLCLLAGFPAYAFAQAPVSVPDIDNVATFEAIPNNLVFEMLGLPGSNIQQPGTVSSALLSLTSIIGADGGLHPGIGISLAPYQLAKSGDLQLKDYIADWSTRFLSNAQFALGTAPSKTADSAVDWGFGLRLVFFNSGDARTDPKTLDALAGHLNAVLDAVPVPLKGTPDALLLHTNVRGAVKDYNNAVAGGNPQEIEQARNKLIELTSGDSFVQTYGTAQQERLRAYALSTDAAQSAAAIRDTRSAVDTTLDPTWNATSLDFNLGVVYRASESKIQKSDFRMFNAWLNGGIGFGPGQFLAQIGMQKYTQQGDSIAVTAAAMLRFGNAKFRFGLGGNGVYASELQQELTASLVSEYMVSQSAWVVFSVNAVGRKGARPEYIPQFGIKTNGGFFHL